VSASAAGAPAAPAASAASVAAGRDGGLRQRFVDWWLTPDQQGRWWLERGQPERAARHFADPFWRGLAHAQAGQWQAAADAFARADSAAAWFNQAQALARLGRFVDAVAAYDQALLRVPGWPEALADRERVRALIPPEPPGSDDAELQPGEGEGNEAGQRRARKSGPPRRLTEAEIAALWLQRLDTSPAGFLQRKFALQARDPTPPGALPGSSAPSSARSPSGLAGGTPSAASPGLPPAAPSAAPSAAPPAAPRATLPAVPPTAPSTAPSNGPRPAVASGASR
jgi:Ca-activated chloride channel family protein